MNESKHTPEVKFDIAQLLNEIDHCLRDVEDIIDKRDDVKDFNKYVYNRIALFRKLTASAPALLEENERLKKEIANHQVVNSLMAGDDLEVSLANKVFELKAEVDRLTKEKKELQEALDMSIKHIREQEERHQKLLTRIK